MADDIGGAEEEKLRLDRYLLQILAQENTLRLLTTPVSAYESSNGTPLSLSLEVGSRKFIEIWVKSSAAATFKVYDKREGGSWREADEIELTGAGEVKQGYWNSRPWAKVETTDANNNEIEIAAS